MVEQGSLEISSGGNVTIRDNNIQTGVGIYIVQCDENIVIEKNHIYDGSKDGIWIYNTDSIMIMDNNIRNNEGNGIFIGRSKDVRVHNNFIQNNGKDGIRYEEYREAQLVIINNTIQKNSYYGVNVSNKNALVKNNNFIGNNPGGSSQAFDHSNSCTFIDNYWDDWIAPDENSDRIVDEPYHIDPPNQSNYDLSPHTQSIKMFMFPYIIYPHIEAILGGNATIQWTNATFSIMDKPRLLNTNFKKIIC